MADQKLIRQTTKEDGINFGGDSLGNRMVYWVRNGQVVGSMPAKDWHEQEFDMTPVDQIPNSLEEWCSETRNDD